VEFFAFNVKEDHGMALFAPAGLTSSNLVYQESFSGTTLDSDWHTYITSNAANGWPWNYNGSGGNGRGLYYADYDMPSQVSVTNGLLNLKAIDQPVSGINQGTAQTDVRCGQQLWQLRVQWRLPSDQHEGAERRRRMASPLADARQWRRQKRR
jgi:hypothetical protein